MKTVLVENPVLNSPFVEPERHFRFDDEGITSGGFWSLVRPVHCGGSGSYDTASPHQSGGRDSEIAASASSCP